jgi:hypothetical protein
MARNEKWIRKFSRYGSHVPVFLQINREFDIKSIIEIGSGLISTRFFLDHFDNLERLVSYEANEKWYEEVKSKIEDERFVYNLVTKEDKSISNIEKGDLLFVDGLKNHRIYALNKLGRDFDLVVWHDCKMGKVVRGTNVKKTYKYRWTHYPQTSDPRFPPTMVLSNKIDVRRIEWDCRWTGYEREIVEGYLRS